MKDFTQITPHPATYDKVRRCFRRGLKTYHNEAKQQAIIAQRLCSLIAQIAPPTSERVFEFGVGTGHLTQALTQQFNIRTLYLNDLVEECAAFTPPNAAFIRGPIETLELPHRVDLICSASTVQWVEDIPALLNSLSAALRPGGVLALSGFGTAQFQELRRLGSTAVAPSYLNARDWPDLLPETLEVMHVSQRRQTAWFRDGLAVLKHLRETGVNGAASQTWTSRSLKEFDTKYRERFGTQQGLPLTYDPVWLVARKLA